MAGDDILIIGAGIAGFAAGRALQAKGYRVRILEARSRIGGRIHSEDGFDYGAHWIHGTEGNPLTNLARNMGLPLYFVGGDSSYTGSWERMSFAGGKDKDASIIAADQVADALDGIRAAGDASLSLADGFNQAVNRLGLSGAALDEARWHQTLIVREDCGTDADRLSARYWDEGYEVYGYGDSLFLDSFASLTEALARDLSIEQDCEVTAIRHSGDGVEVETGKGHFRADKVIVTVPLGVLKAGSIAFEPTLPPDKQAAINRLGFGTLAKLGLRFDAPFWPEQGYCFGLKTGNTGGPTVMVSSYAITGKPDIILLTGGSAGARLEALSEAEMVSEAMGHLRAEFGDAIPEPVAVHRTGWSRDPFARGSYAHVAVGSRPLDFAILGTPVGNTLFFAGEATNDSQWATAHGAYISGLREAARISGDPAIMPPRNFTENRRWRDQLARASRFFNLRIAELPADQITARTELLYSCPAFAGINITELRLLATMFEERQLAAGEWLCREGDVAEHAWLVMAGELDVLHADSTTPVATLGPGSLSGEYGLFHDARRTASMRARTEVTLLALDYPRFHRFLLAFPQASLALLKTVIERSS
jgi:monoamine oxidase